MLSQTIISLLHSSKPKSISHLHQIHALLITYDGLFPNFPAKLIYLSATSGHVHYSHRLLRYYPTSYVIDWNTVIRAYANTPSPNQSLRLFVQMMRFGVSPDHFTFPFLLKASSRLSSIRLGVSVHSYILRCGHNVDLFVSNSLIHFYASCCDIMCARKVFDEMPQRTRVSWNSMLNGYAKCGDVGKALEVFKSMPDKDVVSWSSIIDGLVKGGEYAQALTFFERMVSVGGPKPNEVTMVSVLRACAHLGAFDQGKLMHRYIVENELPLTLVLLTSLVDMYAKCGAIEVALAVFRGIPKVKSDVFLWNAIIGGLANHGSVRESLDLFKEMSTAGVEADEITYLCLLSACAHGGLVKEAWNFFEALERNGMTAKCEHYACMIDVLARAGVVEEAYDLLCRMPLKPTPAMLGSLLSGCMNHGRLDLAELLGKKLVEIDPHHDGRYVGLSNVYAAVNRWDDAKTWRQAMDTTGVKKFPGLSYVEISGMLEMFKAHDKTHPKSSEVYAILNLILMQMRRAIDCEDECLVY
ncbi:pentatricopeptide repeat-containing protein At5g08305 [Silene latifolia]|uniref:pentatricopeptide repeat-containing protein At5g08305 n=1 Tax=Silene latifolia TaxID=37657 RepID=UPI003D76B0A1